MTQRDVAAYFGDDRLIRSGFVVSLRIWALARGEYPLILNVVSADGTRFTQSRIYSLLIVDE
jgi:hypothetical protein